MPRKQYAGAARSTTLSAAISDVDTTFTIGDATGWPDGSVGSFVVTLDRGTASEEKVLCQSRTTTTVTVATGGRGYDGTTAASHASGADCRHTLDAVSLTEAMTHMYASSGTGAHPEKITGSGTATLTVSSTAPTSPAVGDLWVNTA